MLPRGWSPSWPRTALSPSAHYQRSTISSAVRPRSWTGKSERRSCSRSSASYRSRRPRRPCITWASPPGSGRAWRTSWPLRSPASTCRRTRISSSNGPEPGCSTTRSALAALLDDEQAPVIGDALEAVRATIDELETGGRDEISCGAGDEHLVWASHSGDAGADMHGNADHAVTYHFALAGVQPGANLKSQRAYPFAHGTRATYRPGGAVESGEEAVTRSVHLAPTKSGQLFSHHRVPVAAQLAPSPITHLGRALDPTMSVNITVATTRSGSSRRRSPVMNSSMWSAMMSCVS